MRFIRKGGRVIPIKDGPSSHQGPRRSKALAAAGAVTTAVGLKVGHTGTKMVATGAHLAQSGFVRAVQAARRNAPGDYSASRSVARAGARVIQKGAKKILVASAITGTGIGMITSGMMRKKKHE